MDRNGTRRACVTAEGGGGGVGSSFSVFLSVYELFLRLCVLVVSANCRLPDTNLAAILSPRGAVARSPVTPAPTPKLQHGALLKSLPIFVSCVLLNVVRATLEKFIS